MKFLGTIAACFPHVDTDTRSILQVLMDQARDYDDFAERLCEKVLKDPVPVLLTYFAYFHAYNQNKYALLNRLMEAQTGSDLTQPFELTYGARRGDHVEWGDFQKAIAAALKMTKNDWMACHVYIAWREGVDTWFPESATDSEPLDILESRIKDNEEFHFFLSSLHHITARRLRNEGAVEDARTWYDRAISLAKKHDDLEKLAVLLLEKANMIKNVNISEALSILKIQKEICDQIGYVDGIGLNVHALGHIAMAKGEYDAAIEHQKEYTAIRKNRGLPIGLMQCIIAFLYNQKGDGERALELTTEGIDDPIKSTGIPYALIQESYALLNLDRNEEAAQSLDKARELSLKTGDESILGLVHFMDGLIEKQHHEFAAAQFSLEKALDIFEKSHSLSYINMALIQLTDVEIETYPYDKKDTKAKLSGPWMERLIKHVKQRDLPGIAAQTMLLQAKFHFKQGQLAQSRKMLKRVLKFSKTSSMHYLKDMAESVIPDLFVS